MRRLTLRRGVDVKSALLIDGTQVTATAAEINAAADIATAGTVEASKGLVVDANKDLASLRNFTATGTATLGAVAANDSSLDIAGLAATSAGNGGAVAIVAGRAHTNGTGGGVTVTGGAGDDTGVGGAVSITGGASGSGATGNGGAASVVGGAAASTDGDGGDAVITGGAATGTGRGGAVTITSGASAGATGTAGSIAIDTGDAATGTGGTITIGGTNATAVSVGRSGQTVNLKGAAVTATAAELNLNDNQPASVTFAVGGEAGNVIVVTMQVKDAAGSDMATRSSLFMYLSDDANGDSIATTAPDGGWAIGTDGLLIPVVANKAAQFVTEADGDLDVAITESAGATWYLIAVLPNGLLTASAAITFAA